MRTLGLYVLVDNLKAVVVDIRFVYQADILALTGIALEHLDIILLDLARFGYNIIVLIGNALLEEMLPFVVGKRIRVESLQLLSEVGYQIGFVVNRQVVIPLLTEVMNQFLLQLGLALIGIRLLLRQSVFR